MNIRKTLLAGAMLALSAVVVRGDEGVQQKYKRLVEPLREKSINYELTLEDQPSGKRFTMVRNGARFEEIIEVNGESYRDITRDYKTQHCSKESPDSEWECYEVRTTNDFSDKVPHMRLGPDYGKLEVHALTNNPTAHLGRIEVNGVSCEMFDFHYEFKSTTDPDRICIHESGAPVYMERDDPKMRLTMTNFTTRPRTVGNFSPSKYENK